MAKEALAALPEFKQFVFIPAARSPGKATARASGADRLHWLKLAAEPLGFKVWDWELARGGNSFTVDTLTEAHRLGARADRLCWLLGADAYESFPRWKSPEKIRALARLLVVERPGKVIVPQLPADRILAVPTHPASSTAIRAALGRGDTNQPWIPPPVKVALDKLLPVRNPYATN